MVARSRSYEARCARHERVVIPAQVLLESYAVLTRLPVRLAPGNAKRILEQNFFKTAEIAGLAGGTAWSAIQELSQHEMGGVIIYDTVIAHVECQGLCAGGASRPGNP